MNHAIFLCDGQGSVEPNIGKEKYDSLQDYKKYFNEICDLSGENIQDICWGEGRFKLKSNPYFAHLALLANEYALFNLLLNKGINPSYITGHSLGEVYAYIFSGAIDLKEGIRLIKERGRLFLENSQKNDSDMLVLGGEEDHMFRFVEDLKKDFEIYTANYNAANQIVISIKKKDVLFLMSEGLKRKLKCSKLNLGNGCHSPLISCIHDELKHVIHSIEVKDPKTKIYSASFNQHLTTASEVKEKLHAHLLSPVYWYKSLKNLVLSGYHHYIEIGYSKVLKGLMLNIQPDLKVQIAKDLV